MTKDVMLHCEQCGMRFRSEAKAAAHRLVAPTQCRPKGFRPRLDGHKPRTKSKDEE